MVNRKPQAHIELIALMIMNIVPIVGVLFFDWQAVKVVMFYWLETLVLGVFAVLRLLSIWSLRKPLAFAGLVACLIFCLHFGLFSSVHGFFILSLLNQDSTLPEYTVEQILPNSLNMANQLNLWWPLCSVVIFYGLTTIKDIATRQLGSQREETIKPYKRIAVQQFTILGCAFLGTIVPKTAFLLMLVMVGVKTVVDIYLWRLERLDVDAERA